MSQPVSPTPLQDFTITVDGQAVPAKAGQTVAAVLLAAGRRAWNCSASGTPRGVFCGMGVCYDCVVTIEGLPEQRACITPAVPGMQVETRLR